MSRGPWTAGAISALKGKERLCCLSVHDYATARVVDELGFHLVLVGDSLAMTVLGYANTLPVTVDQMLHHTAAVVRGTKHALVVADMPFMSYQAELADGLRNAGRFIKEAGAAAVKVEGGEERTELVRALVQNGIPVLGHVGLTPQSVNTLDGYKVQGKRSEDARRIIDDGRALQAAGAFAVVLECVPAALGAEVTAALEIPTIGIGAGAGCDGQILLSHDVCGFHSDVRPKFVKAYAELGAAMREALTAYRDEVRSGEFPSDANSY